MDITFNGKNVHASTGGVTFDAALPTIVFLHGAGMDHTVWFLQSRWFAHRGRGVLALDLPGHGRSDGPLLGSIEAMADWTAGVLDHLGVKQAAFVGHSMGALVSIALAARHPAKARALGLVGAADAQPRHRNWPVGSGARIGRRETGAELHGHQPVRRQRSGRFGAWRRRIRGARRRQGEENQPGRSEEKGARAHRGSITSRS